MATYRRKPKKVVGNYKLLPAYVQNISKILWKLAGYVTERASFTYSSRHRAWLERPEGYSPPIESQVLELVLRELGVLDGEVDVNNQRRKKRFIVKTNVLREKLQKMSQEDLERLVAEKLRLVFKTHGKIFAQHSPIYTNIQSETISTQL
ncbi:MAG: hypothetical protein JHC26_09655 [Thermofilum sp.]|uniref:hypothetical protein n=1 Tax=Thermofilum sp. TaxID=1961369 RepID=UPI00258D65E3|nr:hypothetical protein [Thermofilum sp.]MCI4409346.1 hypothetical protein [Thermofilum sp.]